METFYPYAQNLCLLNHDSSLRLSVQVHSTSADASFALFFAHGAGFHKEIWYPVLIRLARAGLALKAVIFDMWNHGDSASLNNPSVQDYPWSWLGKDIAGLIKQLRLNLPIIGIGHSLGAITMLYAQLKYDCFVRLVLMETIFFDRIDQFIAMKPILVGAASKRSYKWATKEAAHLSLLEKPLYARFCQDVLDAYLSFGLHSQPEQQDIVMLKCLPVHEAAALASTNDATEWCISRLEELKIPTLFVGAEKSELIDPGITRRYARKAPLGRCLILSGLYHAIPMEAPELVTKLIVEEVGIEFKQSKL